MRGLSGAGSAQARAEVGAARWERRPPVALPAARPSPVPRELRGARAERGPGARAARSDGGRKAEALSGLPCGRHRVCPGAGGRDGPCQRCPRRALLAFGSERGSAPRDAPCSSVILPSVPAVSALPPNLLETCVVFRLWQIINIPLQQSLVPEAVALLINNSDFKYKIFREMWL